MFPAMGRSLRRAHCAAGNAEGQANQFDRYSQHNFRQQGIHLKCSRDMGRRAGLR